ncbi:beta-lactamase family protein [Novosphingobium sp. YJ-S2-02]|uniref:Beta-lactamase family protein n=1 Tax=Novosphingobium aureum TaxID=2792964 RepID=A0A931H9D0_9SPHN|nr:serine hydrolase domain-containing protein [Novosphingobium aureum]MBH0111777.1 beta-lactamase family protein [Novosphingobium aureum]
MSAAREGLSAALDRRLFLRLAGLAGLSTLPGSRIALAADRRDLLPRVREVVERWTGPGRFPGMVASLGLPGQQAQFVSRGTQGFTDAAPMGPDSLFRIYSMTKPVTGMAAMQLIAQGKISLDMPVYEVLPEYRHMQVQDRYDGPVDKTHAAARPITMRHLLTHTAGLGYTFVQSGPIKALMEQKGLIGGQVSRLDMPGIFNGKAVSGLDTFAQRLAQVPLVAEPGARWIYSLALDLMGRVIEVVSGRPFDRYLAETIFEPAGMTSTFFAVPASEAARLTTNFGALGPVLVPIDAGAGSIYLDPPPFPFGGSGLVSSPRDYDRFLRILAQYGMLDGRRILAEEAVRLGTSNLLPAGVAGPVDDGSGDPGPARRGRSAGFGAGGRVGTGPEAGVFGWSGAAGTLGMVDMRHALRSQLFVQFMPPDAVPLLPQFQSALKADITALLGDTKA